MSQLNYWTFSSFELPKNQKAEIESWWLICYVFNCLSWDASFCLIILKFIFHSILFSYFDTQQIHLVRYVKQLASALAYLENQAGWKYKSRELWANCELSHLVSGHYSNKARVRLVWGSWRHLLAQCVTTILRVFFFRYNLSCVTKQNSRIFSLISH